MAVQVSLHAPYYLSLTTSGWDQSDLASLAWEDMSVNGFGYIADGGMNIHKLITARE